MERLTRKTFMGDYALEEQDQKSLNRAINLAGELEDIEAELGVSLEVLFKALKNGIYWLRDDGHKSVEHCVKPKLEYNWNDWMFRISYDEAVYVKEFGHTWGLTEDDINLVRIIKNKRRKQNG